MTILGQTLSDTEQERVIREARKFAISYHLTDPTYPIRETAGPSADRVWYHSDTNHTQGNNHFLLCIKAGLQKVISYSNVSTISQRQEGNPTAFLDRLQKALAKLQI